jgi:hypothetical protein
MPVAAEHLTEVKHSVDLKLVPYELVQVSAKPDRTRPMITK